MRRWEADSRLLDQVIPLPFWNPKFDNHVHKGLPDDSIVGQLNPIHVVKIYIFNIQILVNETNYEALHSADTFSPFLLSVS